MKILAIVSLIAAAFFATAAHGQMASPADALMNQAVFC
jgi:hypothetical protein